MITTVDLKKVLEKELVVAVGCTEPIAIAYATAIGAEKVHGDVKRIVLSCSRNVIKNAMAVAIPGMQHEGIEFVGALGAVVKQSTKKLALLECVTPEQESLAVAFWNEGNVHLKEEATNKVLYIRAEVSSSSETVIVVIEDEHTNVTSIRVNGEETIDSTQKNGGKEEDLEKNSFTVSDAIDYSLQAPLEDLALVKESIEMNKKVAQAGLEKEYGLQVGLTMQKQVEQGLLSNDLVTYAMSLAAASSDARMGGAVLPVMANSGSGNQGLAVTMPVVAAGMKLDVSEEALIRGTAISHLIAIAIKQQFGRLSALCGVTIAGASASAGITYLLGGTKEQMFFAIQNTLGNVTGMLCDGAKAGCAMKVATCSSAAVQSALLAKSGLCIKSNNGIIENDINDTIRNFSQIGNDGSPILDMIVLQQMLNKK